ncbi:MAG: sulfatase [Pseudomonadales bacterium]|nr:sulfatase [Pseudomonadales bacterium]
MGDGVRFCALVLIGLLAGACSPATDQSEDAAQGQSAQDTLADTPESQPPNIVILFADDLGYGDLSSYGHPSIQTPNLDAMAAQGQRWTDFYVADPVCSPSRGALLTGRLPVRTGLYGRRINVLFPNDTVGIPDREVTLAEALRERGYRTAIIGKWHLGDAPDTYPTRHGFDYWYGLPYSNDMDWADGVTFAETLRLSVAAASGDTAARDALADRQSQRMARYFSPPADGWNVPLIRSSVGVAGYEDEILERPADQRTLTRRYTREAQRFIGDADERPFLLYLPYSMPHTPLFRSDSFVGVSRGGYYGDVIEELDWSAGEIRRTLEAEGLAENTLVVFTSDNGPWLLMQHHGGSAGHLSNGKGTTYEGGVRVPAVFWWPGRLHPGVVRDPASTLDLFATVMSLTGSSDTPGAAGAGTATDSLDFSGTLLRGAKSPRNELPYYRSGELQAYRKGPWKLRLVSEGAYSMPPQRVVHDTPQLFHLGEDPGERFDVAAANPDVVADLLQAIEVHRAGIVEQAPLFDRRLAAAPAESAGD